MTTNSWFECAHELDADQSEFAQQLIRRSEELVSLGIRPDDTTVFTGMAPLVITVDVPELKKQLRYGCSLQIGYWARNTSTNGPGLEGCWEPDHYILDNLGPPHEPGVLMVRGLDVSTSQLADISFDWLLHQLRLRIVHRILKDGDRVLGEMWVAPASGLEVLTRGRRRHLKTLRSGTWTEEQVVRDYSSA
jgi:hypothetical protein